MVDPRVVALYVDELPSFTATVAIISFVVGLFLAWVSSKFDWGSPRGLPLHLFAVISMMVSFVYFLTMVVSLIFS